MAGATHYNVIRGDLSALRTAGNGVDVHRAECLVPPLAIVGTALGEDPAAPEPGKIHFNLVEYADGMPSGYGAPEAELPLLVPAGICP